MNFLLKVYYLLLINVYTDYTFILITLKLDQMMIRTISSFKDFKLAGNDRMTFNLYTTDFI